MIALTKQNNTDAAVHKLLKYLSINIDPVIVSEELEKHPDYPTLRAVSDVLTALNIENSAFSVSYDELADVPCPFIAYSNLDGESLLVVTKITNDRVTFSNDKWNGKRLSADEFKRQFNGVVLVTEQAENYPPAAVAGFLTFASRIKIPTIIAGIALIVLLALFYHTNYLIGLNWRLILLTLFKTAGLIVSILLLVQSIDSNNQLVQVLCQTTGESNCNAILSSKAAKAFGIEWLSWSEVGFFYFAGTWLLVLFGASSTFIVTALLVLNIVSLPYTFYSIYYQSRIAKQWCILCCTVQGLLWLEFIPLITYQNHTPLFLREGRGEALSSLFICLLSPVIVWSLLKPLLLKAQQLQPLKQQLRKFKYNTELFNQLLTAQPKYAQPEEEWSIVLGNKEASNVITMVSNPYCPPCSKTHKLLDELLEERADLQARIIFTVSNRDNELKTQITRHLVALNDLPDKTLIKRALNDWYNQKQKNYETWAKAYPVALNSVGYSKTDRQKAWCDMAQVTFTPTMLINGYSLPEIYQIADLKYMLE